MTMVDLRTLPPCPTCGSTLGTACWSPDLDPTHEMRDCRCGYSSGWTPLQDGRLSVLGDVGELQPHRCRTPALWQVLLIRIFVGRPMPFICFGCGRRWRWSWIRGWRRIPAPIPNSTR